MNEIVSGQTAPGIISLTLLVVSKSSGFGKTVSKSLQKKIIEFGVKTLYLALDNDAISDTIKMTDMFMNEGIEVKVMLLNDKDPNEIGFENLIKNINNTSTTKFSDLMKYKLKGF